MEVQVGDYFDMYKEGIPTKRVVVRDLLRMSNKCLAEDILTGNEYEVDIETEVEKVLGNIFN